jgi:hypothetical protein
VQISKKDYFKYEIPEKWIVEDSEEVTSIYCNNGEGALTLSYFSIFEMKETLDEHISIMAKKFIDANHIKLNRALILDTTQKGKSMLYGVGSTPDQWFIKLWVVAKFPKVVFATYQSEKKTSEVKTVDKIVSSFTFISD